MATIKPIEDRTVHQIQSGQVIVDLCSVVKELVENSLDAGATSIDVRFKNQGLDTIEVQDNGDGISSHNYETIALKHYTSKLSSYSDLATLQTFGFRGEALSSLCALSNFSIITCTADDAPKGTKLEFEVSGKLKGTGVVAAQKGTTVTVENLFNNLPVRRRELERNIKREWNRVVGVLGQYACIQTGIKFSVSQQVAKGKKTSLFSTKGNQSTRDNIVNVFGAKTLPALVPMDLKLELAATSGPSQRWSTHDDGGKKEIRIVGHMSRPASGEGRQTPDRQMFFVNARPCGLPQVAKAFNEVYKAYNASQSPFIFANIELDTHLYDVNVSPDKRTILLHDQSRMLENLKAALTELFESQDYTVPISQLPAQKQPSYKQLTISRESSVRTRTPQTRGTLVESTDGEESEDISRSSRSESGEEASLRLLKSSNSEVQRSVGRPVSRASLSRDSQAVSLISNWVGRKSEGRTELAVSPTADNSHVREGSGGLSKEKKALIQKLTRERQPLQLPSDVMEEPLNSTVSTQPLLPVPSARRPPSTSQHALEMHSPDASENHIRQRLESPIPALQSPSKLSSAVLNIFSSSKASQAPAGLATITIGDHVVTSYIGTPGSKSTRTDGYFESASPIRPSETPHAALPSFGSRLSQRFAAQGTLQPKLEGDDTELAYEDGNESLNEDVGLNEEEEPLDLVPVPASSQDVMREEIDANGQDEEYIDEDEKRAREDAKVQEIIKAAEETPMQSSQENALRAKALLKGGSKKKDATLNLVQTLITNTSKICEEFLLLEDAVNSHARSFNAPADDEGLESDRAEEKLSLTILKSDFARMKIIGQFNLGFILASRTAERESEDGTCVGDELFIIDQHASDEKYNFERLQATTIVQSQRLVYPKTLDLTAMEEEIVVQNLPALETNGFIVTVDETGEAPVGQRCQLVSLPLSRETAFSITDLEELLALLAETPPGSVPRPSKVRKMFAMRACRSSVMIGRNLTKAQMGKLIKHLGELDKPWNCPHGRPTMRHLCGLNAWDSLGWKEGDTTEGEKAEPTNWARYVAQNKGELFDMGSEIASEAGSP